MTNFVGQVWWGSQSWPQPAFSRPSVIAATPKVGRTPRSAAGPLAGLFNYPKAPESQS